MMLIHSSQLEAKESDSNVGHIESIEFTPSTNSYGNIDELVSVKALSVQSYGRRNTLTLTFALGDIFISQVCEDEDDVEQAIQDMTFQLKIIENQLKQARKWLAESSMLEFGLPAAGDICMDQNQAGD